jgi:hypothetical protein
MNQGTTPYMPTPPAQPMAAGAAMPQAPMMNQGGAMPPPTFQSPTFEDGGDTGGKGKSNSIKDFFSDINLVEASILALGVATFLYAIYYYKFEMTMTKTGYADLNARLNKVEVMTSKIVAEQNANGKNSVRTRKRILM